MLLPESAKFVEAGGDRGFVRCAMTDSDLDRAGERVVRHRSRRQGRREVGCGHVRDEDRVAAARGEGDHGGEVGAGVPYPRCEAGRSAGLEDGVPAGCLRRGGDPRGVCEFPQVDRGSLGVGRRVVGLQDRDQRIGPEGVGLDAGVRGCGEVGVAVEQREVDASLEQQSYGGFGFGLGDMQPQVPVGALQGFAEGAATGASALGKQAMWRGPVGSPVPVCSRFWAFSSAASTFSVSSARRR